MLVLANNSGRVQVTTPILVAPGDADSIKTVVKGINTIARYFPPSKESELTVIKLYDYQ